MPLHEGLKIQQQIIFRQIGAKIAYYRTLRCMTQEELAEKLHIDKSVLSRIERDKYHIHGKGDSIGKGAQRTTLDVRSYSWNGLKIYDVQGIGAFDGAQDEKIAYEAAKSADLALFLLTSDAPQPKEAEELHKLKKLGKPILGIVNVKQSLAAPNNPKRKIDIKQIEKAMNDKQKLEDLIKQFQDFAKIHNDNFDDIPFVYSHLLSAFDSQSENDSTLYELINFGAVENFILEKIRSDGKFIRIKTFIK